jgi:hypothetical protein
MTATVLLVKVLNEYSDLILVIFKYNSVADLPGGCDPVIRLQSNKATSSLSPGNNFKIKDLTSIFLSFLDKYVSQALFLYS